MKKTAGVPAPAASQLPESSLTLKQPRVEIISSYAAACELIEQATDLTRAAAGELTLVQLAKIKSCGLRPEHLLDIGAKVAARVEDLPPEFQKGSAHRLVPALIIPYAGPRDVTEWHCRPDAPVQLADGGFAKYLTAPGHRLPLAVRRTDEKFDTVVITEGDFQSIAVAVFGPPGIAVRGIDGVTMWQEKGAPVAGLEIVSDKTAVIMADSDVATNANVRKQVTNLATHLYGLGARSVRLASPGGVGTQGIDDVIGLLPEEERTAYVARVIGDATDALAPHRADVLQAVYQREVGQAAEREVARKLAGVLPDPHTTGLSDLLAEPDDGPVYRISELWPTGGNVVLAAQRKAGKTTVIGNLVRCLADGDAFLGETDRFGTTGFSVTPLQDGERVGILDLELDRRTLRRWLRDQAIRNADMVIAVDLRGRVGEFNPLDDDRRAAWAAHLREQNVRVLIVDPLAPLLAVAGVDENDNSGVAQMLAALDQLKAEAGVSELLMAHHAGHANERSRGASRLRDWPDAEWRLVREQGDAGQEPPPDAARFFLAEGRDVAVTEQLLAFGRASRRLTISGGNRAQHAATKYEPAVIDAVRANEGLVGRALEELLCRTGMTQRDARRAVAATIAAGEIHTHAGDRRAKLHHLGRNCAECAK